LVVLNRFELLSAFVSFTILPNDFFGLKNFTSLMLKEGLSFYIEFCINFSLFMNFFSLNYTDFEFALLAEYLGLDFLILKVYFLRSSIIFFAKLIFIWPFSGWFWDLSIYNLLFEAFDSLFTLLLNIYVTYLLSFYFEVSSPWLMYFRWMLNPDFTWYFLSCDSRPFFLVTGCVLKISAECLKGFFKYLFGRGWSQNSDWKNSMFEVLSLVLILILCSFCNI
jgi:hypothetical protein